MTTSVLGSGFPNGPTIPLYRSVRLRSSATAYLSRTPTTAGNRRTWTWFGWVKRGTLGTAQQIFTAGSATSDRTCLTFLAANTIEILQQAASVTQAQYATTAVFRDPGAFYFIVLAVDTTQATATDRVKLYINGTLQTITASTTIAQNTQTFVNSTTPHALGRESNTAANYLDGYYAIAGLVDGQQLTPSDFTSTTNAGGVPLPVIYGGNYGVNGFYLTFNNNSAATAAALGKDYSGLGNNWTPNNISLTPGATYDSMLDVPTLTSPLSANYCVLNPLKNNASLTAGNLNIAGPTTGGNYTAFSTMATTSTPIYYECTVTNYNTGTIGYVGYAKSEVALATVIATVTGTFGFRPSNGTWVSYKDATTTTLTGLSGLAIGDVIQTAFNPSTGNAWVGKNGTWYNSGNPATGANPTLTGLTTNVDWNPIVNIYRDGANFIEFAANFGQRPFAYTPPSGFESLNTYNLPTSAVSKGNIYMDATTYTGNGTSQTITNTAGFQPDFIWFKSRSSVADNALFDSVRGRAYGVSSNSSNNQSTSANAGDNLVSFNTNGFTVGSVSTSPVWNSTNLNAASLVAWQWQAGKGVTSSNTAGTITSTVSVNKTAGISIATYTGNATAGQTIGHGLSVKPAMVLAKGLNTTIAENWNVWHESLAAENYFLRLNSTDPVFTTFTNRFTAFDNTTITTGNNSEVNENGKNYILYVFAEVAGFSGFGKYTGNLSTDGPFVYLGFRPKYVCIKRTDVANNWVVQDSVRSPYNVSDTALYPNLSGAESVGGGLQIDFTSNGFKIRSTNAMYNASGGTYIYFAFAENPFQYALAR